MSVLALAYSDGNVSQIYWGELTGSGEVRLHRYVGGWRAIMERGGKVRGPFLATSRAEAWRKLELKLQVTSRRHTRASPGRYA